VSAKREGLEDGRLAQPMELILFDLREIGTEDAMRNALAFYQETARIETLDDNVRCLVATLFEEHGAAKR
jgi:hypothetical protein